MNDPDSDSASVPRDAAYARWRTDLGALPLDRIEPTPAGGLMLGALARNADTAYHSAVQQRYPLLAAAIRAGAPAQLRNLASNGGHLLQPPRCYYFHDPAAPCNRREPGSGCAAQAGPSRIHAVLGANASCIATHASDMCVALAALDAVVHVAGPQGPRSIRFGDFFQLPQDRPDQDTALEQGELVTGIELPQNGCAPHSAYLKLRDRQSSAWTLVSVAVALDIGADGLIHDARVALGGVAHKPWRNRAAELLLRGQAPSSAAFENFATQVMAEAQGHGSSHFKIPIARRAMLRTLERAVGWVGQNAEPAL